MKRRKKSNRKRSKKSIIGIIAIMVMVISTSIYISYGFHQSREQEMEMPEDGWVNVELYYIGCAKTDFMKENKDWLIIDNERYIWTEGELTYTYSDYQFIYDYSHYQTEDQWFKFYDLDFDPQVALEKEKGIHYVFSLGRKLEWLQYKPDEISQFGGVFNRAGKEWESEIEEDVAYFYKFEYSGKHLARVEVEF